MTDSKAQLVTRFFKAIVNGGDEQSLKEILADDVRWNVPPSVMPQFRGPHLGMQARCTSWATPVTHSTLQALPTTRS